MDDGKSTTIFDFFNHEYVKTRFQNKIENDFFFLTNSLILYIEKEIAALFITESIINKF